jgi:hypothetical protein
MKPLEPGMKVLFVGDMNVSSRDGFVPMLEAYLNSGSLTPKLRFFGVAFAGERFSAYQRRLERDVLSDIPDRLVIVPGIADFFYEREVQIEPLVSGFMNAARFAVDAIGAERVAVTSTLLLSEDPTYVLNPPSGEFNRSVCEKCQEQILSFWDLNSHLMGCASRVAPLRLTVDGTTLSSVGKMLTVLKLADYFSKLTNDCMKIQE